MDLFQRQRPMFTEQEQQQITDLVGLIAGAGGLGTHQALELQRCGIKKIYLVDHDQVEPSNLNRQILYGREDIGVPKVEAAKDKLTGYQLETEIVTKQEQITEDTLIPEEVDLIFDALDNFASRYQLEKLAAEYNLPLIHAGVVSWYGQITTIMPEQTYSLEEIVGQSTDSQNPPPVLSPAVSVLASLQVIEGLKVAVGRENILTNQLLLVNLNDYSLQKVEVD